MRVVDFRLSLNTIVRRSLSSSFSESSLAAKSLVEESLADVNGGVSAGDLACFGDGARVATGERVASILRLP